MLEYWSLYKGTFFNFHFNSKDPPLLNRFEKHEYLTIDLLTEEEKELKE